ncbi:SCF ubiquitin ligase complex subunit cdc4 [Tulasnella sp. 427]|nr:SCF ubiquitin ligase complex subunit cdc4 [Tulasnella sp. 427]
MDGTVRIWSLKDGAQLHVLSGHTSLVGLLSLSATTLVSAAADSTLRIWDPTTGKLLHTLTGHTGAITCFQHDENKVLSGSDGTLKIWDTRDGTAKDLLTGINGVWQVVFDRRFCVAASNNQDNTQLEVWDFAADKGNNGDDDDEEDDLGGDDDDNNSETSDPYDELRLAEGDIEDSESEDDGGDVFYDPDDSDFNMDSTSARSGTYNSPTPSHSTMGGGRRSVGPRSRRSAAPTTLDKMSLDTPAEHVAGGSSSSNGHATASTYPIVWAARHGVGPSSSTHTTTTTTTTTSSSTATPGRLHDWTSFGIPSGSGSGSSSSRGGAGSSSTRTPTQGRSQGRRE